MLLRKIDELEAYIEELWENSSAETDVWRVNVSCSVSSRSSLFISERGMAASWILRRLLIVESWLNKLGLVICKERDMARVFDQDGKILLFVLKNKQSWT